MSEIEKSPHNPKYDLLPGEFFDEKHKTLWNIWSTQEILNQVEKFAFRSSDVILATYPKSGTTLVQEILWLLHNNVDIAKSKEKPIHVRVPFLELHVFEDDGFESRNHVDVLKEVQNEERLIKTHVPVSYIESNLSNNKPRVITVFRNPKDTMVSYFHFYRGVDDYGPWKGDWNTFFEMWMDGHLVAGDWFNVVSNWWRHYQDSAREHPHLVVFFEDLLRQPKEEIVRIAEFCGKKLDDGSITKIFDHTRFDKMKTNPSTNYSQMPGINFSFMRKGQIGDWKNYFTINQSAYFDRVYSERMSDCEGLKFIYE